MEPTTVKGGSARRWVSVVALVVLTTSAVVACGMEMMPPPTARVERATVSVSVSASGALSAVQTQNIGFSSGGELDELLVKVGDVVTPGQVLARLDDFAAEQALNQARARLAQQQAALDKIVNGNSVEAAERNLDAARRVLDATRANAAANNDAAQKRTFRAAKELEFYEKQLAKARQALEDCPSGPTASSMPSYPYSTKPPTTDCSAQQQAVGTAKQQVVLAKTALANARKDEQSVATQGRVSIEQARQTVVMAENDLRAAQTGTPADRDSQAAAVRDAQVAVTLAQQDLTNRVLLAPIAGTVASINGAVGEFVGNGSTTTPLAPGSTAAIPGVAASSPDTTDSAGTAPGGSNFIVLGDVNSFQVVVPFEESDAARVQPGQRVEVTFDALPDLTRAGSVLAVAPSGTTISGVTNYYVTVVLTETDPQLRDRQTAEANVLTQAVDDVLSVPNAAVVREGGQSFVNVPGADGTPQRVPFEAGLQGDDRTEVKSGLTEGQEVQLPQATVTASPDTQGGPPN